MSFMGQLQDELAEFKKQGVYKRLNYLDSPQDPRVKMEGRGEVVILSSNNYMGLCDLPAVVEAGEGAPRALGARTPAGPLRFRPVTIYPQLRNAPAEVPRFGIP